MQSSTSSAATIPSANEVNRLTKEWIVITKKKFVNCKICAQFPNVIKPLWKGRIPPIATTEGTRFQTSIVWKHRTSEIHSACINALRSQALIQADSIAHPLISSIKKSEEKLYQKVLYNMYDVYNDSKRGTLSAWSWPSRCMARNAAMEADKIGEYRPYCPKLSQAQYTNPVHHRECLKCIAKCGKEDLALNLNESWAVSVKVDGHVDAYQTENKAIAVTYVTKEGDLVTAFVSTEKPNRTWCQGCCRSSKECIQQCRVVMGRRRKKKKYVV